MAGIVAAQPAAVQVEVAPVVQREVAPTVTLVGTVRPRLRSVVSAEISGYVIDLPVDIGDSVARGEVICRLRDDMRRFALNTGRATLARLEAEARESEAIVERWTFERKRIEGLWEQRVCSEKEHRDTQTEHAAAVARAEAARSAVESQRAVVEMAADSLERTVIRAPFVGVIVSRRTEVGQWVGGFFGGSSEGQSAQGGEIVEMVALDTVRARVDVPEQVLVYAAVGEPATLRFDAFAGEVFHGRIARVAPAGDELARTFPVEIDIENTDGRLRAGMFVRAAVPAGPREHRLIVPEDAVVRQDGTPPVVYVIHAVEGIPHAVPQRVQVLREYVDGVAVEADDLQPGDQVVVRGNERLFGPTPVTIIERAASENRRGKPGGSLVEPGRSIGEPGGS
jgi:RND family efflux transporter MFP subunit